MNRGDRKGDIFVDAPDRQRFWEIERGRAEGADGGAVAGGDDDLPALSACAHAQAGGRQATWRWIAEHLAMGHWRTAVNAARRAGPARRK